MRLTPRITAPFKNGRGGLSWGPVVKTRPADIGGVGSILTGKILLRDLRATKPGCHNYRAGFLLAPCLATSGFTAAARSPTPGAGEQPCAQARRPKAWAQQQRHSTARNKVNSHAEEKKPGDVKLWVAVGSRLAAKRASPDASRHPLKRIDGLQDHHPLEINVSCASPDTLNSISLIRKQVKRNYLNIALLCF